MILRLFFFVYTEFILSIHGFQIRVFTVFTSLKVFVHFYSVLVEATWVLRKRKKDHNHGSFSFLLVLVCTLLHLKNKMIFLESALELPTVPYDSTKFFLIVA